MLDDKFRQLLTAYVDGELSARQRRAVQKLLRRSSEARDLLRKLQADSDALINLPPPVAPDFSGPVLQAIAARGLRPPRRAVRPPRTVSLWTGMAAAAAVLLAVGAASFFIFSTLSGRDGNHPIARKQKPDEPAPKDDRKPVPPDGGVARDRSPEEEPKKKPDDKPIVKGPGEGKEPDSPTPPEKKPDAPEPGPISTSRTIETFEPNAADVAVPSLFRLSGLTEEKVRQSFVKEMGRSDAYYVELLCKDSIHAFPRLQAALQAGGIEVIVDRSAAERLKQTQIKSNFAIYLEDITPEELAKLLAPLPQEDPKADKKKPAYGQFVSADANLFFCPMTSDHRRRLTALLGADPRQSAKPTGPLGVVITRPISDVTLNQVPDALEGAKAPASKAERAALALSYTPGAPRQATAEVRRYLDGRKPARKGTVQVLLVLRGRP